MGDHVCFFYGTLMAPQMLHRVIHGQQDPEPWQKALLSFQPAILDGWRRHRVRGADYPAIIAASTSAPDRTSVLGTLVTGLTDGDIHRLDLFEGDEYVRQEVSVRIAGGLRGESGDELAASRGGEQLSDVLGVAGDGSVKEGDVVQAVTYVWIAGEDRLEDEEWDLETFTRDKLASWVGMDESEW